MNLCIGPRIVGTEIPQEVLWIPAGVIAIAVIAVLNINDDFGSRFDGLVVMVIYIFDNEKRALGYGLTRLLGGC